MGSQNPDGPQLKDVGLGALSGAVAGGLGASGMTQAMAGSGSSLAAASSEFATGAVRSALTQGLGIMTGLQHGFDWKGVAASAIASGAGWSAGQTALGKIPVVGGVASGVAAGAASTLARGGSLGRNIGAITADAVASTVGNMVVSQKANESVGKSAMTGSGSMNTLYGSGGSYDELVRQTAQASYNVDAGNQFAGMANWDLALAGQAVSAGGAVAAGGYAGGIPSAYGDAAFNVEQARAQRIADMRLEALNPAIVHAAPRPGELNVLVTGVGSRQAPDGYGEMRAVPLNMRDALNDPSVASTPGGAILGFGYNVVESVIGNTAALFSPNNLNPVSGEMLSPGQMQRAKEDLVINAGTFAIGGENLLAGAARSSAAGLRAFGESGAGQAFAVRMDQLNYRMGATSYVMEPQFGLGGARSDVSATFGNAASSDYRATFFAANPGLEGQVVVHHAVEQQVLTKFPGVVSGAEIHSLENLRGIPVELNSELHLSQLRVEWNRFYRPFLAEGTSPTQAQLLQKATELDSRFGSQFKPPVR